MPSEHQSLAVLTKHGLRLMVYCRTCGKSARVDHAPLIQKYGKNYPIHRLTHHLTCTGCGKRNATVFW